MTTPGLLIAAPRSGAGKTTLTLGLLRALSRKGLRVSPAKCGPDYIDPGFHAAATGRASLNLDGWAMRGPLLDALIHHLSRDSDLIICEALMGLFDGISMRGPSADGSSASIARRAGWPVLLILDVSGQSESAAAIAKGFAAFDPGLHIAGIILNRVGSTRHHALCTRAIEAAGLPVLGALPRASDLVLPERHLGLVQAEETQNLSRILDGLADFVSRHVEIDRLLPLAASHARTTPETPVALNPPGQRIALARDPAFSFVYPHILAGWRRAGAELLPFSPLADEAPPAQADFCWLPGGYPELHAGRLAGNAHFLEGLRRFSETHSVHGECGGYMVLGQSIEDANGTSHQMAGLLGLRTSFATRRVSLGYRQARLRDETFLGARGSTFRGHEFHYATILDPGCDDTLFDVEDAQGTALGVMGSRRGAVSGSFLHLIDEAG